MLHVHDAAFFFVYIYFERDGDVCARAGDDEDIVLSTMCVDSCEVVCNTISQNRVVVFFLKSRFCDNELLRRKMSESFKFQ